MSADIARYKVAGYCCGMDPASDGGWVRWPDYEALRARVAELERECIASIDEIAQERARADEAEAAIERLTRERDEARNNMAEAYERAGRNQRRAEAAEAALARARDALEQAEACMSIVEPRSDKAEYLRILGVIRAALAPEGKP